MWLGAERKTMLAMENCPFVEMYVVAWRHTQELAAKESCKNFRNIHYENNDGPK